jgi:cytochrome b involved in lipid metabolism
MNTASIQTSIFDTIDGLPIHPLAVHVAVVLLPLSAMALALLVFVPRWRKTYLPLTLIGLAIATVFTFIARESGEALADRVGEPKTHTELGEILFPAAVGLLAVGVAFYFLQKSNQPKWIVQATAGAAIAAVLSVSGLTYFVGHTGAQATWGNRIGPIASPTQTPTPTPTPTKTSPKPTVKTYTSAQVASHNSGASCWSVVDNIVYDLTTFLSSHPGGASAVQALCGKDATAAFTGQHGGQPSPTNVLDSFKLGNLSGTNTLPIAAGDQ